MAEPASSPRGIAVIFAGGVGSRMGHADNLPKQFIRVQGKPILVWTIQHFQNHPEIDRIYLVSLADWLDVVQKIVAEYHLDKVRAIVAGGESAQGSILNGLQAAIDDGNDRDDIVLIHDGVRPIINAAMISDNIRSVHRHGNGITSIPAFETVAQAWEGSQVVETVTDRNKMHILQAPQSFRLGEIYELNEIVREDGLLGRFVDQAHLCDHFKKRLHLVEGIRGNVKITVPLDVVFLTHLIDSGEYDRVTQGLDG